MRPQTIDLIKFMKTFPYKRFFKKAFHLFLNPFLYTKLAAQNIDILDSVKLDTYLNTKVHMISLEPRIIGKLDRYKEIINYKGK